MALLPILFLLRLLVPTPQFQAQVLDTSVSIGYGLATGDVDGDRKPDILLADQKQIVWYRNGDWKRFVMAENLTQRDNVCIAARDIGGDGKVEVAVGAQWNPGETGDAAQRCYPAVGTGKIATGMAGGRRRKFNRGWNGDLVPEKCGVAICPTGNRSWRRWSPCTATCWWYTNQVIPTPAGC